MMARRFDERGHEFLEINRKQAYIPRGSTILKNFWGTAPGFQYESGGAIFFFLPGIPKEFKAMVEEYVLAELEHRAPRRKKYKSRLVRTFGLRESEVADRLQGIEREGAKVGFRAHFPEIHLRISAQGDTEDQAGRILSGLLGEILSRLGEYVFSTDGEMLEEIVGKLLSQRRIGLALAESCTGGLVAHRITNVPGSSSYFERGIVSYSNESKTDILGVPRELIESLGAVSGPVVEAMAEGARRLANTDLSIAISGIAGPDGGTAEKPVGTVFIGLSHRFRGTTHRRFQFKGTREEIKLITSTAALDWIRKFVVNDV
jgi:nicotinamide-nucleotide amidase